MKLSLPGVSMMMKWDRGYGKLVLHTDRPLTELSKVDVNSNSGDFYFTCARYKSSDPCEYPFE